MNDQGQGTTIRIASGRSKKSAFSFLEHRMFGLLHFVRLLPEKDFCYNDEISHKHL